MERVCLIGDAAHAMTPHQGLGGGQGIEDAYILARLLEDPRTTVSALPHALKVYDAIRRPASQMVSRQSLANGLTYGFFGTQVRDSSLSEIGGELIASCRWLLDERGAEKEWVKAESAFGAALKHCGDDLAFPGALSYTGVSK